MPHEPMMPKLIHAIRPFFDRMSINDPVRSKISTPDVLFSGLAIFSFKFPSLLQYDKGRNTHVIAHSMKSLYGIKFLPCDTYMRERLDDIDADQLKPTFKALFTFAQRRKLLEPYVYLNGKYLLSLDGTGMFSSKEVSCTNCCVKNHRDGTQTFYHQVLQGAIVHPDIKQVIPLAPEMIYRKDGAKKNGAENNSSKRWVKQFRKDHPCLDVTVVADALHATEPSITRLLTHNISFILNVKPKSHTYLFEWVDKSECTEFEESCPDGTVRRYRFLNDAPLNCENDDVRVNFLEYWETNPKGKARHFSWVTDFKIHKGNCYDIMRGGRARWKIESVPQPCNEAA
jgi:hypothetical protein